MKVGGSIFPSGREIFCISVFHKNICSWVENECFANAQDR